MLCNEQSFIDLNCIQAPLLFTIIALFHTIFQIYMHEHTNYNYNSKFHKCIKSTTNIECFRKINNPIKSSCVLTLIDANPWPLRKYVN